MDAWKQKAEELFFKEKKSIKEIAELTGISRQSISGYLKQHPDYQKERAERKARNAVSRKDYKREKNRQYREDYKSTVTAETMKREHELAAMLLSHEKYH